VLGPTAESESTNATVIAPDASTTPVTQGRRSRHPDGQVSILVAKPYPTGKLETHFVLPRILSEPMRPYPMNKLRLANKV
jgi:hypothetical protein